MAIATLTKKEQEALSDHGHLKFLKIGHYQTFRRDDNISGNSSLVVECTKCNEVLIELIGGREQEENVEVNVLRLTCKMCSKWIQGSVQSFSGFPVCSGCFIDACEKNPYKLL